MGGNKQILLLMVDREAEFAGKGRHVQKRRVIRGRLIQHPCDGFHSPLLHVLSLPGCPSLQIPSKSIISGEGTSVGASAAEVTSPTTPQLSAVPAKALPICPLQVPQNQQGWGVAADSSPDKIIQATRLESTIRYHICF